MYDDSKIQLRLTQKDFKGISASDDYSITYITLRNYEQYSEDLAFISSLMTRELNWEGTPNIENIEKRLGSDSNCLLWMYRKQPVGWAWNNPNVTFNWISIDKLLKEGEVYGGGAFLSKNLNLPPSSSLIFYSLTFNFWLNKLGRTTIYQYSDSWNRASSILSFKCGFRRYRFLD